MLPAFPAKTQLLRQTKAIRFVVQRSGRIFPAPDLDRHVLLYLIELVKLAANLCRQRLIPPRSIAVPEGRCADAAVVQYGELDLDIAPQCPVEVDQSAGIASGIDQDVLAPDVHVQQRRRDRAIKVSAMPVEEVAQRLSFPNRITAASYHIVQQLVPHH